MQEAADIRRMSGKFMLHVMSEDICKKSNDICMKKENLSDGKKLLSESECREKLSDLSIEEITISPFLAVMVLTGT